MNQKRHKLKIRFLPGVEKNEFEIKRGPEHEHVGVHLDLSDGGGWQAVSHCYHTHILVAPLERGHIHGVLFYLQVTGAMDHLQQMSGFR